MCWLCYLIIKFKEEACMKYINAKILLPARLVKGTARVHSRWIYLRSGYSRAAEAMGRIIRLSKRTARKKQNHYC